jgi:hypothetical protein
MPRIPILSDNPTCPLPGKREPDTGDRQQAATSSSNNTSLMHNLTLLQYFIADSAEQHHWRNAIATGEVKTGRRGEMPILSSTKE